MEDNALEYISKKRKELRIAERPISLAEKRGYQRDKIMGMCRLLRPLMPSVNEVVEAALNPVAPCKFELCTSKGLFTDGFIFDGLEGMKQRDIIEYFAAFGMDVSTTQ